MPAQDDVNTGLVDLSDEIVNVAIGAEFRKAREKAGYTRLELVKLLPFEIKVPTLLNWELGHRSISYTRLIQSAPTLGTTAPELIKRAMERIEAVSLTAVKFDFHPHCVNVEQHSELVRSANLLRSELENLVAQLTQP